MHYRNDRENVSDQVSQTLSMINHSLETMGYEVNMKMDILSVTGTIMQIEYHYDIDKNILKC